MTSINLSPVSSGPLHYLPAIAGPNTRATVTVHNLKMGTKVAFSRALYSAISFPRYDIVGAGTTPIGQELGSQDAAHLTSAQKVFRSWKHLAQSTYRTIFSQQNPIGAPLGTTENPSLSFIVPFADAVAYYRVDAEIYKLVQGGVLAFVSAVAS